MLRKKNKSSPIRIGAYLSENHVSLAVADMSGEQPVITHLQSLPVEGRRNDDILNVLDKALEQAGTEQADLYVSLDGRLIESHTIMRPEGLEESEFSSALLYTVADTLNIDIEDASVDGYLLPEVQGTEKIQVLATRKSFVNSLFDMTRKKKATLKSVESVELSLRNLYIKNNEKNENNEASEAVIFPIGKNHIVEIIHDKKIYYSRSLVKSVSSDPSTLDGIESAFSQFERAEQYNQTAIDLQRSLDYFESSYRQGAVSRMMIFTLSNTMISDDLRDLDQLLDIPVQNQLLADVMTLPEKKENETPATVNNTALGAVGSLLKEVAAA